MKKQSKSEQYYNEWYFTRYPDYSAYEQLTDKQKLAMHKGVGFNLWNLVDSAVDFQIRFWKSIARLAGKK